MTPRAFRSWPGDDRKKTEKEHTNGYEPVGDTCPLCGETVEGLIPTHIRWNCPGGANG